MNKEYRAIVGAGILLQVDDPFLPDIFMEPDLDSGQMKRRAEIYVEATNEALKGIPPERGAPARAGYRHQTALEIETASLGERWRLAGRIITIAP
jgi:hypothetical protein